VISAGNLDVQQCIEEENVIVKHVKNRQNLVSP
jgi:hypothetical protein